MKLALALVLALTTPAVADTSAERARSHFKQGKAFQDAGAYERAAEEYKLAYEADKRPEMLFNIAQVYRLAKLKERALFFFKQYLEKQPEGAGADEARKHVVTLQRQLDDEAAEKQAPPPTVLPLESGPVEQVTFEDQGRGLRYSGIGVATVGMLALGAGLKFGFDARSASRDISDHSSTWTNAEKARFEDGERADRNMKIAYVISGALLVGGGVLYYLGDRAREARVTTYITPQGTAGVAGRF